MEDLNLPVAKEIHQFRILIGQQIEHLVFIPVARLAARIDVEPAGNHSGIARELNVPVLALSQLSRSVENRSPQIPQLADLRESGSIEQDADVVAFIYREDYYNPETDRTKLTDVLIKKHRNGPIGNVELYFENEKQTFRSVDTKHQDPFS